MRERRSRRKAGRRIGRRPPLIRLIGVEALAVAATAGLAVAPAHAGPGDLDPSFGDVGRQSDLGGYSALWSLDVQDDDGLLYGGGYYSCYWYCYESYFLGRLLPDGTSDSAFAAAALGDMVIYDTALQPDGKIVVVGKYGSGMQVVRLLPGGALDTQFNSDGVVLLGEGIAYSVVVDPDGRIVVAGSSAGKLTVVRLLADGALDLAFGAGGTFSGPATSGLMPRIALAPGGEYRVVIHPVDPSSGASCAVLGLSDAGAPATSFGVSGVAAAAVPSGAQTTACHALAVLPGGRVVLGGAGHDGQASVGYVERLLADGTADAAFDPGPVASRLKVVTALATDTTGTVFVAGNEQAAGPGALVVRLLADGQSDPSYGLAGEARLDVWATRSWGTSINDMKALGQGALAVAGSNSATYPNLSFVAKLLGDDAGGSPGVLSMSEYSVPVAEQDLQAVVRVRRSGGSVGAVSVSYATQPFSAMSGRDFQQTSGSLSWADGESGEREITVPLIADEAPELAELFSVVLSAPVGGAGLGTQGVDVQIEPDSPPAGFVTIAAPGELTVPEGNVAQFSVVRNIYSEGAVSVTVRVADSSTASPGTDFRNEGGQGTWQDVELRWEDGDSSPRAVSVLLNRDDRREGRESLTLEVVSPTGGLALGEPSRAVAYISDPPGDSASKGGGGRFGAVGALLLGLAGWLRRRPTPLR